MTDLKLAWLNAGAKDKETNAPVAEAFVPMSDDATDEAKRVPVGVVPLMPCLGVAALPWAPDSKGHAEAVVAESVGGLPGIAIAAWDTRSHPMCANLKPGDVVLHSVGPNQAPQVQLKEETRQVVLATLNKATNEQMVIVLNGEDGVAQINVNGCMMQISSEGTWSITSPNGKNTLTVSDDSIHLAGEVILGGMMPNPAQKIMLGPPTGSPGGPASVPLTAAMGVSVGI